MIEGLPHYISIIFILTTILSVILIHCCITYSKTHPHLANPIAIGISIWALFQAGLGFSGFYSNGLDSVPPRFLVAIVPVIIFFVFLFIWPKGKAFMDSIPLRHLTGLSIVRIPVEIVLYWLALNEVIPELMTFAGRNFDILAGITAPIMVHLVFRTEKLGKKILIAWNVISLCLLLFIVVNATLSTPTVVQQFAFEQPNIAIFHFPFIWLPSVVVPIVLFTHFVSLRQLLFSTPLMEK